MEYSKGPWEVQQGAMTKLFSVNVGSYRIAHIQVGRSENEERSYNEEKANANLIVSAVNSCISMNPDNPMAVAEGIEGLVKALKVAQAMLIDGSKRQRELALETVAHALAQIREVKHE